MTNAGVHIPVTANVAGAQQAASALQNVANATNNAAQAAQAAQNPWTTAAQSTQRLGQAAGQAAGNRTQGMLLLSQALDDAQYGLRGVANNIPGLLMGFGASAAAAGAFSIAITGLSVAMTAMNVLLKDEEAQKGLDALTPDEAQAKQMERFTAALNAQADAFKRLGEERKRAAENTKALLEFEKEMLALMPKDKDAVEALDPAQKFDLETKARLAELDKVKGAQQTRVEQFQTLDQQTQAQEKIVADMQQRELLQKQFDEAQAEDKRKIGNIQTAMAGGRGIVNPADIQKMRDLEAGMAARKAEFDQRMSGLASPQFTEPLTGDAEKDAEIKRRQFAQEQQKLAELKGQRLSAAQDVQSGAGEVQQAEITFRNQQTLATQQLQNQTMGDQALPVLAPGAVQADAAQAAEQGRQLADALRNLGASRVQALTDLNGGVNEFAASVSAEMISVKQTVNNLAQQVANLKDRTAP